jgi:hypothetical protein
MYDEVPQGFGRMKTMTTEFRRWAHSFVIKNVVALETWRMCVGIY